MVLHVLFGVYKLAHHGFDEVGNDHVRLEKTRNGKRGTHRQEAPVLQLHAKDGRHEPQPYKGDLQGGDVGEEEKHLLPIHKPHIVLQVSCVA